MASVLGYVSLSWYGQSWHSPRGLVLPGLPGMSQLMSFTCVLRPYVSSCSGKSASLAFAPGYVRAVASRRGSPGRQAPTCGLAVTIHIRGKRTGGEVSPCPVRCSSRSLKLIIVPSVPILQEWLNEGYQEYEKRLRPVLSMETVWHKTDDDMIAAVERDRSSRIVCMDEKGKTFTSEQFANVLYRKLEEGEPCRPAGEGG